MIGSDSPKYTIAGHRSHDGHTCDLGVTLGFVQLDSVASSVETEQMKYNEKRSDSAHGGWRASQRTLVRPRGTPFLIAAVTVLALGLSACGGGSSSLGVANTGSTSTTTTQTTRPPSSSSATTPTRARSSSGSTPTTHTSSASGPAGSSGSLLQSELEFAQCMRSNGVPNFPDPNANGGFELSVGFDTSSPTVKAAQAKCQKFLPAGPGSGQPPTAQALANMVKVSQCMRRHGIFDFPDPRTSIPPISGSVGEIADRDGVILVFPSTIDQQSPAFTRAAAACGFKLSNH